MRKEWFTRERIIYSLVLGALWLLWQLFTDELAGIIRSYIPEGGILMYGITHPYIIMPIIIIVSCLVLLKRTFKKKVEQTGKQPTIIVPSKTLTETLTEMHRRLVELQKEKASKTRIREKQFEKILPTLADRMGTVKLEDWPRFRRKFELRIRRAVPPFQHWRYFERPFKLRDYMRKRQEWKQQAYYAALSVASKVKDELFHTKEWTFEDGIKVSDWVDGYNWGIKKLRDEDMLWTELHNSISHYYKDEILRELIERHNDFSLIYNNISLMIYYSRKFPNNEFSFMLCETLIGSPISPEKAEVALGEIQGNIKKRLDEIQEGKSNIKKIIDEILSTRDYPEKTIYILRVLYHDREKLTQGLYSGNATSLDKLVYHQLILHDIVRLEQRKERIYGSDNTKDVGYWVLTDRGKEVIRYLQKNQQVLHNED